jgi:hypothetical protein
METAAPTNELSNLQINTSASSPNKSNFVIVNFAVEIPNEIMSIPEDLNLNLHSTSNGVVGTITFLKNSVMVWIGWGKLDSDLQTQTDVSSTTTGCGMPAMGPTTVAMPRTAYQGMSSGDEAPCSQLIGGTNEEEIMMGNSMASRLAKKSGMPVFVSCSLSGPTGGHGLQLQGNAFGSGDEGSLAVHAAALAEKEVGRIILGRKAA